MKILHISAECYPAAKAGGLGDVVGALPKYLNSIKEKTAVLIPKYHTKWILSQDWEEVHRDEFKLYHETIPFTIQRCQNEELGFPLYVANIEGKYDRPGVYLDPVSNKPYDDEIERSICFQQAALKWVVGMQYKPEVIHCHDHHTGLIPFMMKHCYDYNSLKMIPTVFTIHNGEYHGSYDWDRMYLLPYLDINQRGLLDWDKLINPLATGIKCCWRLTTVSPGYMEELRSDSNGLEWLLNHESPKSIGVLNGIDTEVWNPQTDPFIHKKMLKSVDYYKKANKEALLKQFKFDPKQPLITFIGRLAGEKGAQLLPDLINQFLHTESKASFIVLGTGDPLLHEAFTRLKKVHKGRFDVALEYNEGLAHQLYAGSDFLIMPSKVEPCGLNQMYALRYGTIPIVRSVGGLKDTIIDISESKGRGIRFDNFTVYAAYKALQRAVKLYENKKQFKKVRERIVAVDFSWEQSAKTYKKIYRDLIKSIESPKKTKIAKSLKNKSYVKN